MRTLKTVREIPIHKDVKVWVTGRKVRVKGPKGELVRSFDHLKIDLFIVPGQKKGDRILRAELWFADRKAAACIRTVTSHIENMITGVTKGFLYKMRMVYAHFPISVQIEDDGKKVEIRNFLGEKVVRTIQLGEGVKIERSKDVKDEIVLSGINLDVVSQSAANIQQSTRVCDKDIRKFLDGIYVSHKGNIVTDDS